MKRFESEIGHHYESYSFGYASYAHKEPADKLEDFYEGGFLPYSGSPGTQGVFYMARSARVPLQSWELSSENRRVLKKFDGRFTVTKTPLNHFRAGKSFYEFCRHYFSNKHGDNIMPPERLRLILESEVASDLIAYKEKGRLVAYVVEARAEQMVHFWFSFYDLSFARSSLGMWLMLDRARTAKAEDLHYFYVGTVYGDKALYKTAFTNLEYWDGTSWVADIKLLKRRARTDKARVLPVPDEWKLHKRLFGK